jgi:hypothetical protein
VGDWWLRGRDFIAEQLRCFGGVTDVVGRRLGEGKAVDGADGSASVMGEVSALNLINRSCEGVPLMDLVRKSIRSKVEENQAGPEMNI